MSKLLKNFVGIDASKAFYDVAVIQILSSENGELSPPLHEQFKQTAADYKRMQSWLKKHGVSINEQTLFCMEDTGLYTYGLVSFLVNCGAQVWVEMALRIKKSDDFYRECNDKIDAQKIARYAYRYQDKMRIWRPFDDTIMQLKLLIAQRDRVVTSLKKLKVPIGEVASCGLKANAEKCRILQAPAIQGLEETLANIDKEIWNLVKDAKDEKGEKDMLKKVSQVESIKGVGAVTAVAFYVYTKGFTSYENAKQLACFCGVVPFKRKESGSSVRSKARVSPYANKKLKWLLHMCAMSAIRCDEKLKEYYADKKAAGKNKMSVLNAIRNKLVHQIVAVTRDNRFFQENWEPKCA